VLVGWAALRPALAVAFGGRILDPVDIEARPAGHGPFVATRIIGYLQRYGWPGRQR
jgi:hypothetical protein